jgi:5-(carboxyamino)imidazole ribonucleotide synthase
MTISPAQEISSAIAEETQGLALTIAEEISLIGVMAVEIFTKDEQFFLNSLAMGPHNLGNWTIEGSRTSQFEQHLRAVLDLPLGDPTMTAPFVVMGNIFSGEKPDMYRPYLHLMARNPGLKFHQYRKEVRPGQCIGHVTALGENLQELIEIAEHARDYMSGEIDE